MIGQNPKAEVVPFSSEEIGIKNSFFRTEVAVRGRVISCQNSGQRNRNRVLGWEITDAFKLSSTESH